MRPFRVAETTSCKRDPTTHPPMLYMDITLGKNQMERLPIYEGANPVVLAREFAEQHQLDHQLTRVLEQLIRQQMQDMVVAQASTQK